MSSPRFSNLFSTFGLVLLENYDSMFSRKEQKMVKEFLRNLRELHKLALIIE